MFQLLGTHKLKFARGAQVNISTDVFFFRVSLDGTVHPLLSLRGIGDLAWSHPAVLSGSVYREK